MQGDELSQTGKFSDFGDSRGQSRGSEPKDGAKLRRETGTRNVEYEEGMARIGRQRVECATDGAAWDGAAKWVNGNWRLFRRAEHLCEEVQRENRRWAR
jgi:hypothetical protein